MTCSLIQLGLGVMLLATGLLPFVGERPAVSVGVWLLVFAAWRMTRTHDEVGLSIALMIPTALIGQFVLDRAVPDLGSAIVLFGNLAVIAAVLRNSELPSATIVRTELRSTAQSDARIRRARR